MCLEDLRLGLARYTGKVSQNIGGGGVLNVLSPNARRQALIIALDTSGSTSPECVIVTFGSPTGQDGIIVLGVGNPTMTLDIETHGKMVQSGVWYNDTPGVFTTFVTEIVSNVNPPEYGG